MKPEKQPKRVYTIQQQIRRRTIISFTIFIVLLVAGYAGWRWLYKQQPTADGTQPTIRKSFETNDRIFEGIFSKNRLAKTFPKDEAVKNVRVNGDAGMGDDFDWKSWRLKIARKPGDTLLLTINDLRALPKTEVVFDFKCIEGWSQKTYWGGVRFTDFLAKYHLDAQGAMGYVGLETPDKEYYVGIDMESMLQPQTILCYEMNGKLLPLNQGFPLRLIIPVKYGIKHLKRIGTMFFSNDKPRDYWAERGYDYHSGL